MSWRPFQEKREFHRTCYRLQSVTQSEMQYAPISGSPESNANALGLSRPGPAGNSRIFDAARALVSQLPILMNCRQFKGIPQRKEGKEGGKVAYLALYLPCLSGDDAVAISSRFPSLSFPLFLPLKCLQTAARGAFLKDERSPSQCHLNGRKTANCAKLILSHPLLLS